MLVRSDTLANLYLTLTPPNYESAKNRPQWTPTNFFPDEPVMDENAPTVTDPPQIDVGGSWGVGYSRFVRNFYQGKSFTGENRTRKSEKFDAKTHQSQKIPKDQNPDESWSDRRESPPGDQSTLQGEISDEKMGIHLHLVR